MLLSVKSYTMLVFPVHIFHNKTHRESSVFAMYDLLNMHLTGNPGKVLLYCHVILFRNKPSQSCEVGSVQLIQTGREGANREVPEVYFPLMYSRMDPQGNPHCLDGDTAMSDQNPKYQRNLRSLNLLTTRFVSLLQESTGGVLDLKEVSDPRPVNHTVQKALIPTCRL